MTRKTRFNRTAQYAACRMHRGTSREIKHTLGGFEISDDGSRGFDYQDVDPAREDRVRVKDGEIGRESNCYSDA